MARWCYDPIASYYAGSARFKRPYPRDNYGDDIRWNQSLIRAMTYTVDCDKIFGKDGAKWTDEDTKWYRDYQKQLTDIKQWQTNNTT